MKKERNIDHFPDTEEKRAAQQRVDDAKEEKRKRKQASARRVAWRRKLREEAFPLPEWLED